MAATKTPPQRTIFSRTSIKVKRNVPQWLERITWLDFQRGSVDVELLVVILALVLFGFVMTFSGYFHFSWREFSQKGTPILYFISRQALWIGLGTIAMIISTLIAPKTIYRLTPIFFIFVLILNLLPSMGFGLTIRGGTRWISLGGLSFQPSELAKLAMVLYLARIVHGQRERLASNFGNAIRPMAMVTLLGLAVYFQNDLSTSIFLFGSALLILFMGGMSVKYLLIQLSMMLGVAVVAIFSSPFRIERLMIWLKGDANDLSGNARQALMSLRAIRGSGITGSGLGQGSYKLGKISLVQSDYIFAAIVEELGLIGIIAVISLFLLLLVKAYHISTKTKSHYISFLAISLAVILSGQAFLNMAVVVGIFPVTGLPLPFFSAGGSNILVSMIISGLLLNLSRQETPHG
ncbi:FtsW/RodA/SpoVE family cell cycle protein [Entomospira entomophila]|uniref:Probable peptidoglycan glycosyltransferase FtsW n=1 Tax=Entomospira entomophila TaxID=2719988 RepID=A0A968KVL6_9SPIO|nr:FtsW/RodA/SpoVE family cell cycle protein [Entomospira entomophilus]NIZ39975.1 FtsW/RodA/SpoVE family cell cycle protein [Entomospira entomophilus]WDI35535.1 FtsW/RodA/SpoVE family cell cycle protein [Entomospira entomophilus]